MESRNEKTRPLFRIEQLEDRVMPAHLGHVVEVGSGATNASHEAGEAVQFQPRPDDLDHPSHFKARIIGLDNG
jgi:hypothetical protein